MKTCMAVTMRLCRAAHAFKAVTSPDAFSGTAQHTGPRLWQYVRGEVDVNIQASKKLTSARETARA
jgi:hypothetical protein